MFTAKPFSSTLSGVTDGHLADIRLHWPNQRRFTERYVNPMLIPALADALGCAATLEHPFGTKRIDTVFHRRANSGGAEVVAALEHENNLTYSGEEIVKLRDFAAPLGVLITYASQKRRASLLAEYDELLTGMKQKNISSEGREILIVLGPYGFNPPKSLVWDFFVHKGDYLRHL